MTGRGGVTLVELIVVIVLLGVVASVSGLAMRRAQVVRGVAAPVAAAIALRDSALRSGRAVTGIVSVPRTAAGSAPGDARPVVVTAYPDGRLLADRALHIDPMSGTALDAPR